MKQLLTLVIFSMTTACAMGMHVNKIILSHTVKEKFRLENPKRAPNYSTAFLDANRKILKKMESKFVILLAQELSQPDASRWPQIKPLLQKVGGFLSVEDHFADQLMDLCADPKGSYEKWCALLEIHRPILMAQWCKTAQQTPEQTPEAGQATVIPVQTAQAATPPAPQEQAIQPAQKSKAPTQAKLVVSSKKPKKKIKKSHKKSSVSWQPAHAVNKQVQAASPQVTPKQEFDLALLQRDYHKIASLLTEHKSEISVSAQIAGIPFTPLHFAAFTTDCKLMDLLLQYNSNVNQKCWMKFPGSDMRVHTTPLAIAVSGANIQCAKLLLDRQADPNLAITTMPSNNFQYVLDIAAAQISPTESKYTPKIQADMVMLLLLNRSRNFKGNFFFWDAVNKRGWQINLTDTNSEALIPAILDAIEKISCRDGDIYAIASQEKLSSILTDDKALKVKTAIDPKAKPIQLKEVDNLFWKVLNEGSPDQLETFLLAAKNTLDLNVPLPAHGLLPLHFCATQGKAQMCKVLIAQGAKPDPIAQLVKGKEPNQRNYQISPLTLALLIGSTDCTRELLCSGAGPNLKLFHQPGNIEQTPLSCITHDNWSQDDTRTEAHRSDMLKLLLQSGATEFPGLVFIYDPETKINLSIDLHKEDDQIMLQWILAQENSAKCINCKDGNITIEYTAHFKVITGKLTPLNDTTSSTLEPHETTN